MSTAIERYVISHISGSKSSQVEEFDFSRNELSIGRAADSDIRFDPEVDSVVSRSHGSIIKEQSDPPQFSIVDHQSRNGIFVNKVRLKGKAKLNPGDVVQLGSNGPSFSFDIYPRPHDMMMATQVMEIPTSIRATSITEVPEAELVPVEPVKTGLGKQTVERMLVSERKKSYATIGYVAAILILVLGGLGFYFKDDLFGKKKTIIMNTTVVDSTNINKRTADEIARENEDRVVQIEFAWEIFDAGSGDQLWHEYTLVKDPSGQSRYAALFIQTPNGGIEPYIDVQKNVATGLPVGGTNNTGTGFVVSNDGYILTNRHVAASWNTRHDYFLPQFGFPGILVNSNKQPVKDQEGNPVQIMPNQVSTWVPAETRMMGGRQVNSGTIQGRNKYINVVFAGTSLRRPVISVTPSDNHDVALIRADIPPSLSPVKMKDYYDEIKPGQSVVVMGYPGIAPDQFVVRRSNDPFNPNTKISTVPTPTVTPGNIGRIIHASSEEDKTVSTYGDSYQLTINATGGGNSGGPLFDEEGNVIGIYYAGKSDASGTRISFAVPIKYGLELMGVRKVSKR